MAQGGFHVTGYREVMRGLKLCGDGSEKSLKDGLKKAAEPVTSASRQKIGRYAGASTGTIGPRVVQKGVFVTQRAKKKTGKRPDFGALQMRRGLIPALEENRDETIKLVEDEFRKLSRKAGF